MFIGRVSHPTLWKFLYTRRVGEGIHLEDWLLKLGTQPDPLEATVLEWVVQRASGQEHHPETGMGFVPVGVHSPQCSHHAEKKALKALLKITIGNGWVGHWTPLHADPFRICWCSNPEAYRQEHAVAPSVLPCRLQDKCMMELCQELARYMARAGLQSKTRSARPSSKGWRCSHSHSILQACYPSAGHWGTEAAQQLKDDTPVGESRRHPCFRAGQGSIGAPVLNVQSMASHPPLAPHDPILPMSSSAPLWKTSTCK